MQVFGLFIAFGVFTAWLLTMLFVPAYIMLLSEEGLKRGLAGNGETKSRFLTGGLKRMGRLASRRSYVIPAVFIVLVAVAIPGLTRIDVNDNPVRWFKKGSEIRVATDQMNRHFPGTYNASLLVETDTEGMLSEPKVAASIAGLQDLWAGIALVGQSISYVDVVTHDQPARTIPDNRDAIVRSLESADGPIGGLITADYRKANVQLFMKSGDNQTMQGIVDHTDAFLRQQPLPPGVTVAWGGETYLNLVWQDKMVSGMLTAFLTTLGVVALLLALALPLGAMGLPGNVADVHHNLAGLRGPGIHW